MKYFKGLISLPKGDGRYVIMNMVVTWSGRAEKIRTATSYYFSRRNNEWYNENIFLGGNYYE